MRRRRGDLEPDNKGRPDRENPQAGDIRAETYVENQEDGRREAGSGLRPNRKNKGLRMADPLETVRNTNRRAHTEMYTQSKGGHVDPIAVRGPFVNRGTVVFFGTRRKRSGAL